ncbi:hypothetical protein B0I08_105274 [Glaciihabitans tibetensis]|uniref:Fibronectin type III domain protein n=1 Tax=Glaciihabitans tibetensis TaxID=1266600 RepID=A0A2T0VD55_9MICO|nr:Ig-like domain-containing protein [Glaciihabitans tibetensis]PRY68109.1 hypothetical protein B0I08_105274 [Glaciihabitans tibetensis]
MAVWPRLRIGRGGDQRGGRRRGARSGLSSAIRPGPLRATAVTVALTLLVGGAVVAHGFEVEQTPVNDSSIWAVQGGESGRYARVNTDLGELDTVKTVLRAPSALVQSAGQALLFAQNNERVVSLDPALPIDYGEDAAEYGSTPIGTRTVVSSGDTIGYLTSTGSVFVARLDGGVDASPVALDPYAEDEVAEGESRRVYTADAIAVAVGGDVLSWSTETQTVLRFSSQTGAQTDEYPVADGPTEPGSQLSVVGDTWVMVDVTGESVWIDGQREPVAADVSDVFALQRPSEDADVVYLADDAGLVSFALNDGVRTRILGDPETMLGTPAAPTPFAGAMFAAWTPRTGTAGTLWSDSDGESSLDYGGAALTTDPSPVFQSNGTRMIVNESASGWVWTAPDGILVPSSQNWGIANAEAPRATSQVTDVAEVVDPKPPVAEADSFGVRAGELVLLPALLNDHDPNDNVLSVIPSSVSGLPEAFGTTSVTEQWGTIAVRVAESARGSATFTYAISDGTQDDGLNSALATVTLTVFGDEVNNAPVWCGVEGCLREWPTPEVQPGGAVTVSVLGGWVDPEGDPIFVQSVTNGSGVGSASATPSGTVVFQHPNAAELESAALPLTVRVSDVFGAVAEKALAIAVTPTPALTAEPFGLVTAVGERVTVDPAAHVSNPAGAFSVTSATLPGGTEGQTVNVNSGGSTFDFVATRPGTYSVSYTIADTLSEVVSLVRITVVEAADAALTTSPVTVFVRPKTDTSVDVFTAVANPASHVLLLSDAVPDAVDGAALDVDVVGQNLLRVRGNTANEQPGLVGVVHYTVSDGNDDPLYTVSGEATVYLLPASVPQRPIAINDAIVVRAGAQVDIPVLANDVGPDGNVVVLNPESITSPAGTGLAFAAGSTLRYLAPMEAGPVELGYSVYIAGSPELVANASVSVEVVADGENRAPLPRILTGRVLSGQAISVPFASFGVDPDGDDVILADIITQPATGTASLSETGDAIVYTSVAGFRGAVEFEYSVQDSRGERGTSLVRIGVLDQQSDPSPITFSDYVEVQVGSSNQVVVHPTANDVEPTGAALSLTSVTPDATKDTAEYSALATQISTVEENRVTLTSSDEAGVFTFAYTVTNPSGDTGIGLIVMKVVRESVPDFPVVSDTILSLEDRALFADGIDVVTGKVSWASGDVGKLTLSLWGDPVGIEVSGWKIRGQVPDEGMILPFELSGETFQGAPVVTYGFLRIPAREAIVLTLKRGTPPQVVAEDAAVQFDMSQLVSMPEGEQLEVDATGVRTSGTRAAATCAVASGTLISYTAGAGAPWADSCTVPVRLAGQEGFTQLVVAIVVEPAEAQPELRPASLTISPAGEPITWDLSQMVQWQGDESGADLVFAAEYAGDQFVVSQNGSLLTLSALDTASPGRENAVTVSLTSHPDVAAGVLSLKVGPAPSTLPRGGTVAQTCSQAAGSSCLITVIGTPNEVNLYTSTPLVVVSVAAASNCAGVSFAVVDSSTVQASWSAASPGGTCQASFVVQDAQSKQSAGDRNGSVTVDLQGYPQPPSSLAQVSYDDGSVTLKASAGAASYPAISGFAVYSGSARVATCGTDGSCTAINGLTNGDKRTYEVKSVNAEGESRAGVSTVAWSYDAPGIDSVTAIPVYEAGVTSTTAGVVEVTIVSQDRDTAGYDISGSGTVPKAPGSTTTTRLQLEPGDRTIAVNPVSRFERPAGNGPVGSSASTNVTVAAAPSITVGGGTAAATINSITAPEASGNGNFSPRPVSYLYIAYDKLATQPRCAATPDGSLQSVVGAITSSTRVITGVTGDTQYNLTICVSNGFGVAQADAGTTFTWSNPAPPTASTYTISDGSVTGKYAIDLPEFVPPRKTTVKMTEVPESGAVGDLSVAYCSSVLDTVCTTSTPIKPATPGRAHQMSVDRIAITECAAAAKLSVQIIGDGTETAGGVVDAIESLTVNSSGVPTWEWTEGPTVPTTATSVRNVKIVWTAESAKGLEPYKTTTLAANPCTPVPAPAPEPTTPPSSPAPAPAPAPAG